MSNPIHRMAVPPLHTSPLFLKPLSLPFPSLLHTATTAITTTTRIHLSTSRRPPSPLSPSFPHFPLHAPTPSPPPPEDTLPPLGDCLVFDEDAFDHSPPVPTLENPPAEPESLVPERWHHVLAEVNRTKKEKRRMAQELQFGSKVLRKTIGSESRSLPPPPVMKSEEYLSFRKMKLSQLRPVVLDDPKEFGDDRKKEEVQVVDGKGSSRERAVPRDPKAEIEGQSLESIGKYFDGGDYVPGGSGEDDKKPGGSKKLFSQEEKALLNKRVPNLSDATSKRWLPLHTLAASGEFYLMDALLKYDVDINSVDADGLRAIHKAILGKKQAILNYLLRESANPFVHDNDGATLMHYAVERASSLAIKMLLLYNVDINLPDDDGWTPLHLAVQTQRTDIVKLLLIKGADKTLRNKDGLTPLDLCLYSGKSERTYEIIKLLKKLPKARVNSNTASKLASRA